MPQRLNTHPLRLFPAIAALLALAFTLALAPRVSRAQTARGVVMGNAGDHWLDTMQHRRIERATVDGTFGYALTYRLTGADELVLFWPRSRIDLAGDKPPSATAVMDIPGGRLYYPEVITAESLPKAYPGILWIEGEYRDDARGGAEAMTAFALVFASAEVAPTLIASGTRIMTVRVTSSSAVKVLELAPTTMRQGLATTASLESATSAIIATSPTPAMARPMAAIAGKSSVAAATTASAAAALRSSSSKLGRALEKAGHTRPPGAAAHHIVARTARDAKKARRILARFGIDIDDAANGVFLPRYKTSPNPTAAAVHGTLHTKEYYAKVTAMLSEATTKDEALAILDRIRQKLLAGGL